MSTLPILNYHGIESKQDEFVWQDAERPYLISLSTFDQQVSSLLSQGFQTIDSNELKRWLEGDEIHEKPIMLTFDDGHISHYQFIAPLFKQKGLKAIFFIPTGLIGHPGHMDWLQLKELIQMGFEVGSHGVKHIPFPSLTHHELWKEMDQSKKILEDKLGITVKGFSVPRGFYQLRIREVAMELGYQFVFTSRFDTNPRSEDPWRLNRLAIKSETSFQDFTKLVNGRLGYRRVLARAKEAARSFLRPALYDRLADLKRILIHD